VPSSIPPAVKQQAVTTIEDGSVLAAGQTPE
jgi:hypothetical protein